MPSAVLVLVAAAVRLAGAMGVESVDSWGAAVRCGLAAMLVVTASAHFASRRRALVAMVPPRLPRPELLVSVTGVLEVAIAVGLLVTWSTRVAGAVAAALFVIMFPANVHAARDDIEIAGRPATPIVPRTLMQVLFVAAALTVAL